MNFESIIIIGPPYAGKGTQCQLLAKRLDFYHFSSGEMFRKLDASTPIGAKVKQLIDQGKLADDEDLMSLAKQTLELEIKAGRYQPEQQYLLLDGLPRTVGQVPMMAEIFEVKQILVLNGGSREYLIARALRRFKIEGRVDDSNPEKINRRLDTYWQQTEPVIRMYSPKIVVKIDGTGSANLPKEGLEQRILAIHQDILKKILHKR